MSKLRTIKVVYDKNPVTGEMIPWVVRVVTKGDHYGRYNGTLVHMKDDPLVEFYDARYDHENLGQFVTRYYLSTLLDGESPAHLSLDGGVDSWTVSKFTMDKFTMDKIRRWLHTYHEDWKF
jgi:hypothetical protein